MNLLNEQDFEKLSQEDLGLLLEYIKEKEALKKGLQNLENQNSSKDEYLQKLAEVISFDTTKIYEKRRNGYQVMNEIIDNLTLFEYCSRIWEDQHQTIQEKFEYRFLAFKSEYQSLKNANVEHDRIINNFLIKYRNEVSKIDSEIINHIGSLKLTDVQANLEKYELMLQSENISLNPEKNSFELSLSRLEMRFPNTPEGHMDLLNSDKLSEFEERFLNFLKMNSYKILHSFEESNFQIRIENFEDISDFIFAREYTPNRQALAIYFLLHAAGVSNIDLTIMAKFIQFVTRRNLGAKKIADSEIYKNIKALKFLEKDEAFLTEEFNKLNIKDDFLKFSSKIRKYGGFKS
ncbi:MAG: hypothetical protein CFE21_18390 [Bacteroidetes bacterium B1(2017)]|nr:MAG: hypothetical protein CFE21_18390 [Bacteroidetes bacterium B1(2017)]